MSDALLKLSTICCDLAEGAEIRDPLARWFFLVTSSYCWGNEVQAVEPVAQYQCPMDSCGIVELFLSAELINFWKWPYL